MSDLGCSICQEAFTASATCVATKCGHVFHKTCVSQWISNSRTCPSCRAACPTSGLTRLYFTTSLGDTSIRDLDSITDKLLAAQEKSAKLSQENMGLKADVTKLTEKHKNLKKLVSTLDEMNKRKDHVLKYHELQMKDYDAQKAKADALSKEVAKLAEKVEMMSRIETVMSSSAAEAEELTKGQCSKTLAFLVVNLKRELQAAEAKKNEMFSSNCCLNNTVKKQTIKIESLEDKMKSLETEFYTIQNQLRSRLKEAENRRSSVSSSRSGTPDVIPATPPISGSGVAGKEEPKDDSPYLRLAASSVGLAPILRTGMGKSREPLVDRPPPALENLSIFQGTRTARQSTIAMPFQGDKDKTRPQINFRTISNSNTTTTSSTAATSTTATSKWPQSMLAGKSDRFKDKLKSGAIKRPAPYQPK